MKIIHEWPPNISQIRACLHVPSKNVFFAWGDRIYNPSGIAIEPEIMAHERVHGKQQGDDPAGWWVRYLVDPKFRIQQELEAHRAEWAYVNEHGSRRERRFKLKAIAKRLSGPMYGNAMSTKQAIRAIQG